MEDRILFFKLFIYLLVFIFLTRFEMAAQPICIVQDKLGFRDCGKVVYI